MQDRLDYARSIAESAHFKEQRLESEPFELVSFQFSRENSQPAALHVFIEGDGQAWRNKFYPSADPSPTNPIGLRLAVAQSRFSHRILYLARPCQFTQNDACLTPRYWTDARWSPEVISAYGTLLRQAAQTSGLPLVLHGYSGGGTIATLVAGLYPDLPIRHIYTYGSPMNLKSWSQFHGTSYPAGSINPAERLHLTTMLKTHYCGRDDEIVPCALNRATTARIPTSTVIEWDLGHEGDWAGALIRANAGSGKR